MDFRDIGHYFDFGNLGANFRWKFGVPTCSSQPDLPPWISLDGSCVYFDNHFEEKNVSIVEPLLTQTGTQLVIINCEISPDQFEVSADTWEECCFLYTSSMSGNTTIPPLLSKFRSCVRVGLFVYEMTGENVIEWTGKRPNLESLGLGSTTDRIPFDRLFSQLPDLKSLYLQMDNGECVGRLLIAGPGPDEFPIDTINANLKALGANISNTSIEHLGLQGVAPGLMDFFSFVSATKNLDFMRTILLQSVGISPDAADLLRSRLQASRCNRLGLRFCKLESVRDLSVVLRQVPELETLQIRRTKFSSGKNTGLEDTNRFSKIKHFELSESEVTDELALLISALGIQDLEYFCVNSSVFSKDSLQLMKQILRSCTRLKHLDIANTHDQGKELLAALPIQTRKIDFVGIRGTDGIAPEMLCEKFPQGIDSLYAGRLKDGSVNHSLLQKCQVKSLSLAEEDGFALIDEADEPNRFLVQLSLPQLNPRTDWIKDVLGQFPNVKILGGRFETSLTTPAITVVPNWNGEWQTELLELLNKL